MNLGRKARKQYPTWLISGFCSTANLQWNRLLSIFHTARIFKPVVILSHTVAHLYFIRLLSLTYQCWYHFKHHLVQFLYCISQMNQVSFNMSQCMILQGTTNFPSLKVPWYIILLVKNCVNLGTFAFVFFFFLFTQLLTENIKSELRCMCRYTTKTSQGEGVGYFLKQVMLPHGQILDIIGLDTGSLHVRKLRISI